MFFDRYITNGKIFDKVIGQHVEGNLVDVKHKENTLKTKWKEIVFDTRGIYEELLARG